MIDLDDALAHARATLRAEAARVADTEATLEAIRSGHADTDGRSHAGRGRFLALTAASIMVIGGLIAVAWVQSDDAEPAGPDPSLVTVSPTATATVTVPPTAAPTTPATSPATVVVPPAPTTTGAPTTSTTPPVPLSIGSVVDSFFVDDSYGWLTTSASDGSLHTYQTADGGATWQTPGLPEGTTAVRFADRTNGWAFSSSTLYATHDGGSTWVTVGDLGGELPPTPVLAIGTDRIYVPVVRADGVGLDTVTIAGDQVVQLDVLLPFGAGPVMDVSIVAQPSTVWMVYNDRTVQSGVRIVDGVVDATWLPPAADQGGPASVRGDRTGGPVWAVAQTGVWAGDVANPRTVLYVSNDQGLTFREVTPPGIESGAGTFDVSVAGPSDVVVSTLWGDAGTTLLHSSDAGATWTQVSNVPGVTMQAPQYLSASVAIATVNAISDGHQEVWRTDDAGATWHPLAITATP